MFCNKCGAQVADGTAFCPSCGAALSAPAAPASAARAPKAPANNLVEKFSANPLFLAAIICMSVTVLFQLASVFSNASSLGQISGALNMIPGGAGGVLSGLNVVMTLLGLCSVAISVLILVGLWFVYVSSLGADKRAFLAKGLNLTRLGVFIELIYMAVIMGLAAIALLLGTIVGAAAGSDYGVGGTVGAIGFVAFLIVAGIGVLYVFYYLHAKKAVEGAENAVAGRAVGAPSMFLVVVSFVFGGFAVLGLLSGGGAIAVLNGMAGAGTFILFGIVALQFRKEALGA